MMTPAARRNAVNVLVRRGYRSARPSSSSCWWCSAALRLAQDRDDLFFGIPLLHEFSLLLQGRELTFRLATRFVSGQQGCLRRPNPHLTWRPCRKEFLLHDAPVLFGWIRCRPSVNPMPAAQWASQDTSPEERRCPQTLSAACYEMLDLALRLFG